MPSETSHRCPIRHNRCEIYSVSFLSRGVACHAPLAGLAGHAADYDGLSYEAWMLGRGYSAEARACQEYPADDALFSVPAASAGTAAAPRTGRG